MTHLSSYDNIFETKIYFCSNMKVLAEHLRGSAGGLTQACPLTFMLVFVFRETFK